MKSVRYDTDFIRVMQADNVVNAKKLRRPTFTVRKYFFLQQSSWKTTGLCYIRCFSMVCSFIELKEEKNWNSTQNKNYMLDGGLLTC